MLKTKINWSITWSLVFLISTYITYVINSTHFDLTKAADFEYYRDYLSYFFGEIGKTNREQGLIYFFLVSFILKISEMEYGFYSMFLNISNGILLTNYLLYLIGLAGLFKLLKLQNIKTSNIFRYADLTKTYKWRKIVFSSGKIKFDKERFEKLQTLGKSLGGV